LLITRSISITSSERRMLADALGQDTVDYLDQIGADGEVPVGIDLETGEISGVG
jgi:hypothetical protein